MKEYTLRFNFLIPMLIIAFLIVSIAIIVLMVMLMKEKGWEELSIEIGFDLYSLFVIGLFSIMVYQLVKGFLTETLWIKITEEHIEIRNLASFRKHILTKRDISSIFRSNKKFGRGTWETVVIYAREGKCFELVQFNYFDFKKIIEVLIHFGYREPMGKILTPSVLGQKDEIDLD